MLPCYDAFQIPSSLPIAETWNLDRGEGTLENALKQLASEQPSFETYTSWSSYHLKNGNLIFVQHDTVPDSRVANAMMQLNPNEKKIDLWGYRFAYPLDELFFMHCFAEQQSISLHSASYQIHKNMFVFCGVSGAGKTTISDLLHASDLKGQVICDDRNILTLGQQDNAIHVSGTPWHGSGRYYSPNGGPLKSLVFLDPSHDSQAKLTPLSPGEALDWMMRGLFFPISHKNDMELTMDSVIGILEQAPLYLLNYNKQKTNISDFLMENLFSP